MNVKKNAGGAKILNIHGKIAMSDFFISNNIIPNFFRKVKL